MNHEKEAIRVRHQVRLVADSEEGASIHRLPAGVYGFTFAPAQPNLGLFAKEAFQSFEIHKISKDQIEVLCYLDRPTFERLETAGEPFECRLYPEPHESATELASVPADRILTTRGPSRESGNYLTVRLAPATR